MSIFEDNKLQNTSVSELGEFGLIDHITKSYRCKNKSSLKGVGDDAAVLDFSGDKLQLLSTDMLVENIHFDLSYTPLKHLGYKAVAVNVSDICAMNGKATQITVSIAFSNRFPIEAIEELYSGIYLACEKYNVDLVGGDTTSSTSGLIISVSVVGEVEKEKVCYRKGAKIHDLVVCTGDLGAAYLGLQILKREKEIFLENPGVQPDLEGNDYTLQRQLKAEARTKLIDVLDELKIVPTSMIDISDGLTSEVLHLSKQSEVGITIYEDKLPIDYTTMNLAKEMNLNPVFCALNGGEDYELIFTCPPNLINTVDKILASKFSIIGKIRQKNKTPIRILQNGVDAKNIKIQGWDPFK